MATRPSYVHELVRHWQKCYGLEVDGIVGPQTRHSLDQAMGNPVGSVDIPFGHLGEPAEPPDQAELEGAAAEWPPYEIPLRIPTNRKEIVELFGHPGPLAKPDKAWRRANIVAVRDLPGVERWYNVHKLMEPILREGCRRAFEASGYKVTRGDSWVHRYLRSDPARGLSLHAFGAAADFNPKDNKARSFPRGRAPEPWGPEWMKIWPNGVTREWVEAMESVGLTWGGAWGTRGGDLAERVSRISRCDPMHVELRDQ